MAPSARVSDKPPDRQLDPSTVHALSNQLSVILGFVEIVIAQTPNDDPRRPDLVEIREAAMQVAEIIGRPARPGRPDNKV